MVAVTTIQLCCCIMKAAPDNSKHMSMAIFQQNFIYGHWILNLKKFSYIRKHLSFDFLFQPFENKKIILASWAIQKHEEGRFGQRAAVCQPRPGSYTPDPQPLKWSPISKPGSLAPEGSRDVMPSLLHLTAKGRIYKWFSKLRMHIMRCVAALKVMHTWTDQQQIWTREVKKASCPPICTSWPHTCIKNKVIVYIMYT